MCVGTRFLPKAIKALETPALIVVDTIKEVSSPGSMG